MDEPLSELIDFKKIATMGMWVSATHIITHKRTRGVYEVRRGTKATEVFCEADTLDGAVQVAEDDLKESM